MSSASSTESQLVEVLLDQKHPQLRLCEASAPAKALQRASGPVYVIAIAGKIREGKSTLANEIADYLCGQWEEAHGSEAVAGQERRPFRAQDGMHHGTRGIDGAVVPRVGGGSWLILDYEGSGHMEHPRVMNALLGLAYCSGPTHVVVTANLYDDAKQAMGRMAVSGATCVGGEAGQGIERAALVAEGERPTLFVVVNRNRLSLPPGETVQDVLNDNLKLTGHADTDAATQVRQALPLFPSFLCCLPACLLLLSWFYSFLGRLSVCG